MKWVTRDNVKVDRVACPWLIKRFIDTEAKFYFVPMVRVLTVAEKEGAIPFDVPNVELGHKAGKCSFETMLDKYQLTDPALQLLAKIVHGADLQNDLYGQPESQGLKAIAEGFRLLGFEDDHEILESQSIVYDALYAYCRARSEELQSEPAI